MSMTPEGYLKYIDALRSNQDYTRAVMSIRDEEERLAFKRGIEQKLREALRTKSSVKAKEEESKKKRTKAPTVAMPQIAGVVPPSRPPPSQAPSLPAAPPSAASTPATATASRHKATKRNIIYTDEDENYYYFYTYKRL